MTKKRILILNSWKSDFSTFTFGGIREMDMFHKRFFETVLFVSNSTCCQHIRVHASVTVLNKTVLFFHMSMHDLRGGSKFISKSFTDCPVFSKAWVSMFQCFFCRHFYISVFNINPFWSYISLHISKSLWDMWL